MSESVAATPALVVLPIAPMGKPKPSAFQAKRGVGVIGIYYAWAAEVRIHANQVGYTITDRLDIEFHVPMPASWPPSKKCRFHGQPHRQRPDLDNMLKAFGDALTRDDAGIWHVRASKIWAYQGAILIFGGNETRQDAA